MERAYIYIRSFIMLDNLSEDTACFNSSTLYLQTYNFMVLV